MSFVYYAMIIKKSHYARPERPSVAKRVDFFKMMSSGVIVYVLWSNVFYGHMNVFFIMKGICYGEGKDRQ